MSNQQYIVPTITASFDHRNAALVEHTFSTDPCQRSQHLSITATSRLQMPPLMVMRANDHSIFRSPQQQIKVTIEAFPPECQRSQHLSITATHRAEQER